MSVRQMVQFAGELRGLDTFSQKGIIFFKIVADGEIDRISFGTHHPSNTIKSRDFCLANPN